MPTDVLGDSRCSHWDEKGRIAGFRMNPRSAGDTRPLVPAGSDQTAMLRSMVGHSAPSIALVTTTPTKRQTSISLSISTTILPPFAKSHLSNTTPRKRFWYGSASIRCASRSTQGLSTPVWHRKMSFPRSPTDLRCSSACSAISVDYVFAALSYVYEIGHTICGL